MKLRWVEIVKIFRIRMSDTVTRFGLVFIFIRILVRPTQKLISSDRFTRLHVGSDSFQCLYTTQLLMILDERLSGLMSCHGRSDLPSQMLPSDRCRQHRQASGTLNASVPWCLEGGYGPPLNVPGWSRFILGAIWHEVVISCIPGEHEQTPSPAPIGGWCLCTRSGWHSQVLTLLLCTVEEWRSFASHLRSQMFISVGRYSTVLLPGVYLSASSLW